MMDSENALDEIDTALIDSIRDNQRKLDTYNAAQLIKQAAVLGVVLQQLPWEQYPGLNFRYRPYYADWPEIHLLRFPVDWRIQEVGIPGATYDRGWRWHIRRAGAFELAVIELASWGGDPGREPYGWSSANQ